MRIEIKDKDNFITMFNSLFPENKINTINGICIDSRKIRKNDIFIPIKGKYFDGNAFVLKALELGAIVSFSENNKKNANIINIKSSEEIINKMAKTWKDNSKHKIRFYWSFNCFSWLEFKRNLEHERRSF